MFELDQVGLVMSAMRQLVQRERETHAQVYKIIEDYLASMSQENAPHNILILGGDMGLKLLQQQARDYHDYVYELYAEKAFWHANNLANLLSQKLEPMQKGKNNEDEDGLVNRVVLKTQIAYNKFQIQVDLRYLITIYATLSGSESRHEQENKQTSLTMRLIQPPKLRFFQTPHEFYVMAPEIHLIDIYRTLYSPQLAGEWEEAMEAEEQLFKQVEKRFPVLGGAEHKHSPPGAPTFEERREIMQALYKEFITGNPHLVLVGEAALALLENDADNEASHPTLQIISARDVEEDFAEIQAIIQRILRREVATVKFTRGLHILQDFRITRTTIKMGVEGEMKDVMYIYNSAQYELIPFTRRQDVQVGQIYVLLRFFLIDIWILRWIQQHGAIEEQFGQQRLLALWQQITTLHRIYRELQAQNQHLVPAQDQNYLGVYEDEIIAQKLQSREAKKFFDYVPREYYEHNGQYR